MNSKIESAEQSCSPLGFYQMGLRVSLRSPSATQNVGAGACCCIQLNSDDVGKNGKVLGWVGGIAQRGRYRVSDLR